MHSRLFLAGPLMVRITPDGSPSMQEYRKKILQDMIAVKKVGTCSSKKVRSSLIDEQSDKDLVFLLVG